MPTTHQPLQPGRVYRTRDLVRWSSNPTRFAERLVKAGQLQRLAHGLFVSPKPSRFGPVPPSDEELMRGFLGNTPFVLTGPDRWNALGLGTSASFAAPLVYNIKRSGTFALGGRRFLLRRVAFPKQPSPEWFVVDLFQHAEQAAADRDDLTAALGEALRHARFDSDRLRTMAREYGSRDTQARVSAALRAAERAAQVPLVHDDPDFDHLLRIVAARRGLAVGLVEKDYWVTHVLWSLHDRGFEVWFKGGTSLSKGFGLIERFSEDLDLKIEPGHVADLPLVTDWHRESRRATDQRRAYFEALPDLLRVPGADAGLALGADGTRWTGANIELRYPVRHAEGLGPLRPFVLLEVGSARVTPSVERDLTSFVHEYLGATDRLGDYDDNRPRAVRCVHPLVTLVEKLDNLHTRVPRDDRDPATFVRHFEDAARIIAAVTDLPPLVGYADISALVDDMLAERQIRQQPASNDPAFAPGDDSRWRAIRGAHAAIAPMFWGERIDLDAACATLRDWIASTLERR